MVLYKVPFEGYVKRLKDMDRVEKLRFPTVYYPKSDRCLNTFNRLRNRKIK